MTMKNKRCILVISVLTTIVLGCSPDEPQATASDKANLERLHSDGIGKVMADQASKDGKKTPSLANPDGGPGPAAQGP